MAGDVGAVAIGLLRVAGVRVDTGLTDREFAGITSRFGFEFGDDHRALLTQGLPVGEWWVDWRSDSDADLWRRLDEPVMGAMAHVEPGGLWLDAWGPRPADEADARARAFAEISRWPRLIPIYSHRYTEAAPSPAGAPVLSIVGTDVIYYGAELLDYLAHEFGAEREFPPTGYLRPVPPWTVDRA